MPDRSALFGAGAYGEVYLHYLREGGIDVACMLDDDVSRHGDSVDGVPVIGGAEMLPGLREQGIGAIYVAIGNNPVRRRLVAAARAVGLATPSFLHAAAIVASDLVHGEACYVLPGSIIMPKVRFGDAVMVSIGAHVAHHTVLEDGVFLSTGASLGAGIMVGQDAYFGMKATAVTGRCNRVGQGAYIGACSNLIADVPPGATVAGNPARILREAS